MFLLKVWMAVLFANSHALSILLIEHGPILQDGSVIRHPSSIAHRPSPIMTDRVGEAYFANKIGRYVHIIFYPIRLGEMEPLTCGLNALAKRTVELFFVARKKCKCEQVSKRGEFLYLPEPFEFPGLTGDEMMPEVALHEVDLGTERPSVALCLMGPQPSINFSIVIRITSIEGHTRQPSI
jgi:hypothetical protein